MRKNNKRLKGHLVYFSLGSNLGDRSRNLEEAGTRMAESIGEQLSVSRVYETDPWGFESDHTFYNCCIGMRTQLEPIFLLEEVMMIERSMGRNREGGGYADRLIDIDVLFYNHLVMNHPRLTLPHPALERRRFVLAPLAEIAPDLVHPVSLRRISELLEACSDPHTVSPL